MWFRWTLIIYLLLRRACWVMGNIDVTTFWFKIYVHNKMRFTILGSGMAPKCFSLFILSWLYVNFNNRNWRAFVWNWQLPYIPPLKLLCMVLNINGFNIVHVRNIITLFLFFFVTGSWNETSIIIDCELFFSSCQSTRSDKGALKRGFLMNFPLL